MKTITLITFSFILFSCRKNIPAGQPESKFNCVCKTTTEYIDHCGKDSSLASKEIHASSISEAKTECASNNSRSSDSYAITERKCEVL